MAVSIIFRLLSYFNWLLISISPNVQNVLDFYSMLLYVERNNAAILM